MSIDVAAEPRRGLSTRKKLGLIAGAAAIFACVSSLSDWQRHHAFVINATESLPNWAFLVTLGQFPARGQYVVFDPGRDPLTIKHFGQHPSAFAKITYGVPGDIVSRVGNDVLVNGHKVVRLKPFTRQGEPLLPGPVGVIPRGCVFAGSPHKDGFDSRYSAIGFVCTDRLLGVGEAVL